MNKHWKNIFGNCYSLAIFGLALTALAQDSMEERVQAVALELRCPVCRGVPIAESPSQLAQDMMKIIREKSAVGESREEILDYFENRYGEWILLRPKPEGINLSLWILPGLFLIAGLLVILKRVKH